MNTVSIVGAVLTLAGLAGYVAGLLVVYPGRAFSLTAVMVGLTAIALGNAAGRSAE